MYDVIISRLISKETKTNRKSNLTRLDRKMKGIWKGDHSCSSSLQTDTKLAQNYRLSFAMNTTKPEWGNCFSTSDVVVRSVCKVRAGRWRRGGGRAFVDLGVRLSQMKRWFRYEFTSLLRWWHIRSWVETEISTSTRWCFVIWNHVKIGQRLEVYESLWRESSNKRKKLDPRSSSRGQSMLTDPGVTSPGFDRRKSSAR